ncbi:hypothetical protein PG997_002847 [Apiospora hydei]|uniref:Uncharacterized protein n=1 Tax=Apiospora hydei TaxID=1337664 RepID=A0ABR1WXL9_9PEZI
MDENSLSDYSEVRTFSQKHGRCAWGERGRLDDLVAAEDPVVEWALRMQDHTDGVQLDRTRRPDTRPGRLPLRRRRGSDMDRGARPRGRPSRCPRRPTATPSRIVPPMTTSASSIPSVGATTTAVKSTVSSSPKSTGDAAPQSVDTGKADTGLSTGAKAAIGVGVSPGAILCFLAGMVLLWSRRRA